LFKFLANELQISLPFYLYHQYNFNEKERLIKTFKFLLGIAKQIRSKSFN